MRIRLIGGCIIAVLLLAAAACSGGRPAARISEGALEQPVSGGTVTYAYVSPFQGLFEPAFVEGEDDTNVLDFITEPMFKVTDDLTTVPHIASWEESEDHLQFTFKIKPGVYWHNGDELTVDDWKFAIETIASPDYTGSRYYSVEMIKGVDEYHSGKAEEISGIQVLDPYRLRITMKAARANAIDNLWAYPMNENYYKGIAVKDMPVSDQVRKAPIGLGPFQITSIQPGVQVEMERFEQYHQGEALLDRVLYKVVNERELLAMLEQGEIDIASVPRDSYPELSSLDKVTLVQSTELAYEYIGFKFGHWDEEQQKNVMDNPKFADVRLRKAMYYALDREGIINQYSSGRGKLIATPIPSSSWANIDDALIDLYPYDPGKAKTLLDEAGYVDLDSDGLREDPRGQKLVIHYDGMSGNRAAELKTAAILQNWLDVGLDVRLGAGALQEMNAFYEAVENDDPEIELFHGVWGVGSDPDPSGLWREADPWNYTRWYSQRSEELIREGVSNKSFDRKHRKAVYEEWQKLMNDEVPMIFFAERVVVTAVNERLQGVKVNSISNIINPNRWWIKP